MKEKAERIRKAIIDELYGRSGFDHWWDFIENPDLDEINYILRKIIEEELSK